MWSRELTEGIRVELILPTTQQALLLVYHPHDIGPFRFHLKGLDFGGIWVLLRHVVYQALTLFLLCFCPSRYNVKKAGPGGGDNPWKETRQVELWLLPTMEPSDLLAPGKLGRPGHRQVINQFVFMIRIACKTIKQKWLRPQAVLSNVHLYSCLVLLDEIDIYISPRNT